MRAKLSDLQSIPQVVAEMTLDEKLDMVGCYRACHTRPIPDMDVPAIYLMAGATGLNGTHVVLDYLTDPCRADDPRTAYATPEMVALNRVDLNEAAAKYKGDALMTGLVEQAAKYRPGGRQHISFPSVINIGASFDPVTAETIGRAVGQELRDAGVDVCFGPNVDVARAPLGGRNYEMYGEDPELAEQTGEHVFTFKVKLNGETKVQAVAGDCIDEDVFRKVDAPNPDYKLHKTKSKSANWV